MKSFKELSHADTNTLRYRRARRFSDMMLSIMRDFIPNDRIVYRRVLEVMLEVGWEENFELINVPPELDALNAAELARHMIETHPIMLRADDFTIKPDVARR